MIELLKINMYLIDIDSDFQFLLVFLSILSLRSLSFECGPD